MRRIAAVFASRRSDKSDAAASQCDDPAHAEQPLSDDVQKPSLPRPKSRFFLTLSRRPPPPSSPLVTNNDDYIPSSSSSSTAGPTTPDDDARSLHRVKTFLHPFPDKAPAAVPTAVRAEASPTIPHRSESALASAAVSGSPTQAARHARNPPPIAEHAIETGDESEGSEGSHSSGERSSAPPPPPRTLIAPLVQFPTGVPVASGAPAPAPAPAPLSSLSAIEYARALATNGLLPPCSPPPFLHVSDDEPLFPRSCNASAAVSLPSSYSADALLPQLFHKRLLRRLSSPSAADERALAAFARRQQQPRPKRWSLLLDDTALPAAYIPGIHDYSCGLQLWTARPCFEDRFVVYLPNHTQEQPLLEDLGDTVCVRVSGTGLGVAALEYSETLELMAGLYTAADVDAATMVGRDVGTGPGLLPVDGKAQDTHSRPAWPAGSSAAAATPALTVDIDTGGLGGLLGVPIGDVGVAMVGSPSTHLGTAGRPDVAHTPALMTPSLSMTPSTMGSPVSSGPPTPTGIPSPPAGVVASAVAAESAGKLPVPASGTHSSAPPRVQPYKAMPSPLRIEQNMLLPSPWSPVEDDAGREQERKQKQGSGAISVERPGSTSPAPTTASTGTSTATITPRVLSSVLPKVGTRSSAPPTSPSSPRESKQQARGQTQPRPAVRFAEPVKAARDGSDTSDEERRDNVPLGYVQRIKQRRLEKARFLATERARRAQIEEAQRRAERAKQEEEERKRVERERERREKEEERRMRLYAEEVAAARSRRQSTRFMLPSLAGMTGPTSLGAGPAERERERRESGTGRGRAKDPGWEREDTTHSRPAYDTRRQSDPAARSHRNGSPAPAMLPPPVIGQGARNSSPVPSASASGSQRGSSAHSHLASPHPASLSSAVRSSSAPDVRPREARSGSSSPANRASMISDAGSKERTSSFSSNPPSPLWMTSPVPGMNMGMNMNRLSMNMGMMNIPAMPMMAVPIGVPVPVPVPGYGMPMGMEPLIPPTPPFVMQQFGYRPPSQQTHTSSRDHSRSSSPGHSQPTQSSQRRSHSSSPTPPHALQPPEHQLSQQRSHSSSPTSPRGSRDAFPPSSSRAAVMASHHWGQQHIQRQDPSPSPRSPREYTHHRRSSADVDLHRLSQSAGPSAPDRDEHKRENDDRRRVVSAGVATSRPPAHHASTMPPPMVVAEPRNLRPSSSGFQILSRPSQARRQTIIS